jgi:hypothetical protein
MPFGGSSGRRAGPLRQHRPPRVASKQAEGFIEFIADSLNVGISHVYKKGKGRNGGRRLQLLGFVEAVTEAAAIEAAVVLSVSMT